MRSTYVMGDDTGRDADIRVYSNNGVTMTARRLQITLNVLEDERKVLKNKLFNTKGELKESKNKTKMFKDRRKRLLKKLNSIEEIITYLRVD